MYTNKGSNENGSRNKYIGIWVILDINTHIERTVVKIFEKINKKKEFTKQKSLNNKINEIEYLELKSNLIVGFNSIQNKNRKDN